MNKQKQQGVLRALARRRTFTISVEDAVAKHFPEANTKRLALLKIIKLIVQHCLHDSWIARDVQWEWHT